MKWRLRALPPSPESLLNYLLAVASCCQSAAYARHQVSKRCVAEQVRARQKRVRVPDLTGGGETPFTRFANKTDVDETEMPKQWPAPLLSLWATICECCLGINQSQLQRADPLRRLEFSVSSCPWMFLSCLSSPLWGSIGYMYERAIRTYNMHVSCMMGTCNRCTEQRRSLLHRACEDSCTP